jgi:hypothetical protein
MSLQNAFGDIALEATQAQISELTAQISQLTELVAYLASENANHRPRVSNNRALVVNIDSAQPAIVRLSEANHPSSTPKRRFCRSSDAASI